VHNCKKKTKTGYGLKLVGWPFGWLGIKLVIVDWWLCSEVVFIKGLIVIKSAFK
jgi:hypothetical protein